MHRPIVSYDERDLATLENLGVTRGHAVVLSVNPSRSRPGTKTALVAKVRHTRRFQCTKGTLHVQGEDGHVRFLSQTASHGVASPVT